MSKEIKQTIIGSAVFIDFLLANKLTNKWTWVNLLGRGKSNSCLCQTPLK